MFFRLMFLCLLVSSVVSCTNFTKNTIHHDGWEREFHVYVPSKDDGSPLPLVFALHGGGGTARGFARMTKFHKLVDKEKFIAVYPQGLKKRWYHHSVKNYEGIDGKIVDDIGFIEEILQQLKQQYNIDDQCIYAMGVSNGGILCQQLGIELSEHFTAIASVISQMTEDSRALRPQDTVSVLIMNGTKDPMVLYEGGGIIQTLSPWKRKRGKIKQTEEKLASVTDTIQFWLQHNGISDKPVIEQLPDKARFDGTTVTRKTWKKDNISVVLYRVNNGGHSYPGGFQYLPVRMIGKTCRDIDATQEIWEFFERHTKSK